MRAARAIVTALAAVGALEWIQYALDNFASADEAIPGVRRIRIGTLAPVHFLMADRSGEVATVEFLAGRMLDIDTGRGDMTTQFLPYAPEANERQMLVVFAKSHRYSTPAALVKNEAARVDARRCVSA